MQLPCSDRMLTAQTWCVQAISSAEEEAAKKKVGSAAALKQLDRLRKEAAKTSKEAEKTSEDLDACRNEHKVRDSPWNTHLVLITSPSHQPGSLCKMAGWPKQGWHAVYCHILIPQYSLF